MGNRIAIECERATLEFEVNERFRVKIAPHGDGVVDPTTGSARPFALDARWSEGAADESWYATFGRQFNDWMAAIRKGGEPVLSGRSALLTSRLMRYFGGLWIALLSLWAGILLVCATPLFGSYFLLQMAMFLRSGANGLAQPLVITLVLRGAGRENQGKAIGLRGTANRIASILSPLAMGAV